MNKKRFLTIFPYLEYSLLYKDVGAIPYYLADVCGWEAAIAFFESRDNPYTQMMDGAYEKKVNLILLGFWGGKTSNFFRIIKFLFLKSKEFDVVSFYHDSPVNMIYSLLFKLLNPSGIVYFKLDLGPQEVVKLRVNKNKLMPTIKRRIRFFLSKRAVNLYSAETMEAYQALFNDYYYKSRLHYIPNGFAGNIENDFKKILSAKENIILTVGRLGIYEKHNELLVDAIAMLDKDIIKNWQVYLVGPVIYPEITKYVAETICKYPHLKDTFVFTGNIRERSKLFDVYKKAKIFCLTSRIESFGIVLLEAMYFGNYVISSELPASRDITNQGEIGSLFPAGDAKKLSALIAAAISGNIDLDKKGFEAHNFIKTKFNWKVIVKDIDRLIKYKLKHCRGGT